MIELVEESDIYIGHYGKIPIPENAKCYKCGCRAERRERDNNGVWTRKYICMTHYRESYKERPNGNFYKNNLKILSNYRTGNLDPNCTTGKGYIGQKVTCKTRNIEDLNIKNNNFNCPLDHSIDSELGILQSKIAYFEIKYNRWHVCTRSEKGKIYDYIIIYCVENDHIVRGYIIPEFKIEQYTSISISKTPNRGIQWYEEYRINNIRPYDNSFQEILKDMNNGTEPILSSHSLRKSLL
jgi:hypothetical protein